MTPTRSAGILLHPTSLPGPFGIGDLGPAAARWLEALSASGMKLWQVLPLGPTGYGDSPYQCFSAFAGNPWLTSPEALVSDGLMSAAEIATHPRFPDDAVDFGAMIDWKAGLLDRAHARFRSAPTPALATAYAEYRAAHAGWVDDFALFMALKREHGGVAWTDWA
ncbi:MAG: 4-alpha-glucanotransferase, partial [Candidatus Eisenbacteria bacterium]